ncbi:MAG TPA: UPF0182 family protein [Mycobacteriales bacterium]|nr:UPF0182 family protein [Mycobacteriales bacterium]
MPSPLPTVSRRSRVLLSTVVVLLVLSLVGSSLVSLVADWYWFGEVGFRSVFTTVLWTRLGLFAGVGLLTGLFVAGNLVLAYRLRPSYRPMSLEQQNLDRYRMVITPRIGTFIALAAGACGLIAGLTAQGQWRTWLLYWNATPFGRKDPQFGKDISFYVFEYPLFRYVLAVAFAAVVLAGMGTLFLHWLYGGVRLQGTGERMTDRARAHLWALLGVFLLLKSVAYYLDRYGLVLSSSDLTKVNGASYSDVHYLLPVKNILVFVAAFAAVMFLVAIARRSLLLPGVALGLLGLLAVLLGGVFPFVAEQVYVKPNAKTAEAPFIKRNIDATRTAYGLDGIDREVYAARTTATSAQLRADKGTIPNARLLDPTILPPTFTQTQQVRSFYNFNKKLDIDRYTVDGETQDYVVGVRELDTSQLSPEQSNWINRHTVYTHGYGFVAAPANRVDRDGLPCFVSGALEEGQSGRACGGAFVDVKQPRVYYGELFHGDYAVVGKAPGGGDQEFDRPTEAGQQVNTTYNGKGGVEIGSLPRKLLYALYFKERNFLLSNAVNDNSKVIYVRDPRNRVEKVAPFLTMDGDPYPAVVDGKVVWIIDGYTTSNAFPYSQPETLGEAAADSRTGTGTIAQPRESINYIRNSVKATVDAYDGSVKLYEWDSEDPVLKTWDKALGGIIEPRAAISPELMQHFRYPEDLFKVQREKLVRYHIGDPGDFFSGQNFWKVPVDPTRPGNSQDAQPPYYLLAQFPGQDRSTFQLTTALTAAKRENLASIMTASYDAEGQTKLQVLELPASSPIFGPNQMQNRFLSDQTIAQAVALLRQGQSDLDFGNLLTLPVGGGLLYIEPMYVKSTGGSSYPTLQNVLVSFGDQIAYEKTLPEALNALFGRGASQPTPSQSAGGSRAGAGATQSAEVQAAVRAIKGAIDDLRAAQQKGDFEGIGRAQADLAAAIKRFEDAEAAEARAAGQRTPARPAASASPATP